LREEGVVVSLDGESARVRILPRRSCGGCRACAALGPGETLIEARNLAGARPGEQVRIEISGPDPVLAAVLVYLIPLLGLIAGSIAGTALTGSEAAGLGTGVASLACLYWAAHRYDLRVRRRGTAPAAVERIIERREGREGD
jgi:sigma-E factor negative regulatory protein RseC